MAGKGLPLILAGGAALLLVGGKKKKKKSSGGGSEPYTPEETTPYDEVPPYIPPEASPKPTPDKKRPPGNPPRGESYDGDYWGSNTDERLEGIRRHLKELGYPVEVGPWPVNKMGPKKGSPTMEYNNKDGSTGFSGGDDDEPSAVLREFQNDYNRISKLNKAEKFSQQYMGGLDADGLVGPFTLNGIRHAKEVEKAAGKSWKDLLLMASNKGLV